jgi:hypothetical protein
MSTSSSSATPISRNSSQPSCIGASASRHSSSFQRQYSAQNNGSSQSNQNSGAAAGWPVGSLASYFKNLFGLSAKPTKRSLSEEAESGSPESISEWLRQGSDPNEVDAYGYTPLINACLRGCQKSVKILLNSGADVNKQASHGYTAIHAAAQVCFDHFV